MVAKLWSMAVVLWAISCAARLTADDPAPATPPQKVDVGDVLPDFESTDEQGLPWKSVDHVGKKVLVLYFYPGDFTGGCIKQAQAYRDGLEKIEELGAELVGVSGDEVATHKLFRATYGLKHPILADTSGELAKRLGVPVGPGGRVLPAGADRKPLVDTEGKRIVFLRPVTLARWTIVVDREGKIASLRQIVNPVTDSEEVLKIVEALPK